MKTAEEWLDNIGGGSPIGDEADLMMIAIIKQIQLDAMKEGMRRAAEIEQTTADIGTDYDAGWNHKTQAILTAAEQLTEKKLV
jgi:hypothetical protein